jgi:hypothetical protein
VEGGRVRRFALHTPGGQRLRLDDVGASLRFENGAGSYVELSPSGVSLHARADLTIEAPGRVVRIRGKSVEFEQA